MEGKESIIQCEFFHISVEDHGSIGDFFTEFRERLYDKLEMVLAGSDNPGDVKTAIRIYDQNGKVTSLVEEFEELKKRKEKLYTEYEKLLRKKLTLVDRFIRIPIFSRKIKIIQKKHQAIRSDIFAYVVEYLKGSISEPLDIGVEQLNRSFRSAQSAEMLELIQLVEKEKPAFIFVFGSDDLFSDDVRPKGHALLT